jgi:phasin family protein
LAETQVNSVQRLGSVQQDLLGQAVEATNDQLQLIGRVRDPRGFASAQADLAKRHGQRYVETVKQAIDVVADAWQEYGDRIEKTMNTATGKARADGQKGFVSSARNEETQAHGERIRTAHEELLQDDK